MRNNPTKKQKFLKLSFLFFLSIILVYFYFSFLTVVTTDSTIYYKYLDIIKGNIPLKEWNVVRGPTMPLIIYTITKLFGDNTLGFLLGTFIFFLTTIATAYKIISNVLLTQSSKTIKTLTWILFTLLFIFNPLIIGYYHVMLTEFVAMTFTLLTIYLSIKWISLDLLKEKTKSIIYVLIFITISISMWFLKQPYVIVALIPISLATILSIPKLKNKTNTLVKILTLIFCISSVFLSITAWDKVLVKNEVQPSLTKSKGYLTGGLIDALSNFREVEEEEIQSLLYEGKFIDDQEIKLMEEIDSGKSKYTHYRVFKVLSILRSKDKDVLIVPVSTEHSDYTNVFSIIGTTFKKYPANFIMSYVSNYGSMVNLTPYFYKSLNPRKRFFQPGELRGENESIGFAIYYRDSTFLGGAYEKRELMRQYEMGNPSKALPPFITEILTSLLPIYLLTTTLLISPICFIVLLIIYLTNRSVRNETISILYESLILLFGYSSLHVLSHAITGATVDRYSIVAYPSAIIGCILLMNFIKHKSKKVLNKTNKLNKVP